MLTAQGESWWKVIEKIEKIHKTYVMINISYFYDEHVFIPQAAPFNDMDLSSALPHDLYPKFADNQSRKPQRRAQG